MKRSYIILDNWIYGVLSDEAIRQQLVAFTCTNGYTVVLTTLALTELYNPGWMKAHGPDRVERAVSFLSTVPCVIVEPSAVFTAEMDANLQPLPTLPIKFDLEAMEAGMRAEVLRRLLRRDHTFLAQGHDVQLWADNVTALKRSWLDEVAIIIENACRDGYLLRDKNGSLRPPPDGLEMFLLSLDFRHAPRNRVDSILESLLRSGMPSALTAVRLSSLYFLHTYVDFNGSDRIRKQGSDIADIYHLSLAAYCSAVTTDKNMSRMLDAVKRSGVSIPCRVMTKPSLLEAIRRAPAPQVSTNSIIT